MRLPENVADELKHVGILTIYKILSIYARCAIVGLDNKIQKFIHPNLCIHDVVFAHVFI